ncbi:MAG: FtsX-like permease family protein [Bacteroidia bacterium]
MMLIKIAWRNVWRQKLRSLVGIIAVALGLWAGLMVLAFMYGLTNQRIEMIIGNELSHFQFHHPDFRDNVQPQFYIPRSDSIVRHLQQNEKVKAVTARAISMAMMASPSHTGGAKVVGIDPDSESQATRLDRHIREGNYLPGEYTNSILVSEKLADKYKLRLGSKVVLTMQNLDQNFAAGAFKVSGIYKTGNGMFDEMHVFVMRERLQELLGTESGVQEIAVLLYQNEHAEPEAARYQQLYPDFEVLSWLDLQPIMRLMIDSMDIYTYVFMGIILLALLFSILNTMLMAVLERVRELGMLMAIGMNKQRVFKMILLETLFLAFTGGPIGFLLGWATIWYTGKHGFSLGSYSENLSDFGFAAQIHPQLEARTYLIVSAMVVIMAVLAAIYPAIKALKLNPSEAIRKI